MLDWLPTPMTDLIHSLKPIVMAQSISLLTLRMEFIISNQSEFKIDTVELLLCKPLSPKQMLKSQEVLADSSKRTLKMKMVMLYNGLRENGIRWSVMLWLEVNKSKSLPQLHV